MFENIYGHEKIKSYLEKVIKDKRFASAYLFAGPPKVGKYTTAVEFAKHILGGKYAPEIEKYIFPDLTVVFPFLKKDIDIRDGYLEALRGYLTDKKHDGPKELKGNESIPIDVVRELIQYAGRQTYMSDYKVIIVKNIERMRKEASNSFLKLLEEPPSDTVLILTTDNINYILPTIISRCQILKFGYLSDSAIRQYIESSRKKIRISGDISMLNGTMRDIRQLEMLEKASDKIRDKLLDFTDNKEKKGKETLIKRINRKTAEHVVKSSGLSQEEIRSLDLPLLIVSAFVRDDIQTILFINSVCSRYKSFSKGFFLNIFLHTVSRFLTEAIHGITHSGNSMAQYKELIMKREKDELFYMLDIINEAESDIRKNIDSESILYSIMSRKHLRRNYVCKS